MSDGKYAGNMAAQGTDLFDAAGALGTSMARVGALMVSWPFFMLPARERDYVIDATTRLFTSVGELHLSVLRAAARGLGVAARELTRPAGADTSAAPKAAARVPIETSLAATR
jgi:hypothetical protein